METATTTRALDFAFEVPGDDGDVSEMVCSDGEEVVGREYGDGEEEGGQGGVENAEPDSVISVIKNPVIAKQGPGPEFEEKGYTSRSSPRPDQGQQPIQAPQALQAPQAQQQELMRVPHELTECLDRGDDVGAAEVVGQLLHELTTGAVARFVDDRASIQQQRHVLMDRLHDSLHALEEHQAKLEAVKAAYIRSIRTHMADLNRYCVA